MAGQEVCRHRGLIFRYLAPLSGELDAPERGLRGFVSNSKKAGDRKVTRLLCYCLCVFQYAFASSMAFLNGPEG